MEGLIQGKGQLDIYNLKYSPGSRILTFQLSDNIVGALHIQNLSLKKHSSVESAKTQKSIAKKSSPQVFEKRNVLKRV